MSTISSSSTDEVLTALLLNTPTKNASTKTLASSSNSFPPHSILSLKERYDILRKQIEHEDGLINQRINWFLIVQGFLLVAFTNILNRDQPIPKSELYFSIIGLFGIFFSFSAYIGVIAATKSQQWLAEHWNKYLAVTHPEEKSNIDYDFPQLLWTGDTIFKVANTSFGIPFLTIIVWISLTGAVIWNTWFIMAFLIAAIGAVIMIIMVVQWVQTFLKRVI